MSPSDLLKLEFEEGRKEDPVFPAVVDVKHRPVTREAHVI